MPSTARSTAGRPGKHASTPGKLMTPRGNASPASASPNTSTVGSTTPNSSRVPAYSPRSMPRRPPHDEPHQGFTNATGTFLDGSNSNVHSNRPPSSRSPIISSKGDDGSPSSARAWLSAPSGILPELAVSPHSRSHPMSGGMARGHRDRRNRHGSGPSYNGGGKGNSLVPSPPPPGLSLINSVAGDSLLFSETNMDWTKLNIFRTRLCDRLTQTHSCHMANRCLFSHDVNWPRRTPFLPRASALTLRYIPVWCPRLDWPPLVGLCESSGKISWTSSNESWDARLCHQACTRGDNCPFVHNLEEFLYHPEVYKTRSCCLANDDNFDEQLSTSNCVALCPWYFCPFAHDVYELRDLRAARYAWHPPPQIVDNQFVARTQGFDEVELEIIDFVRKAANGSQDLYTSSFSPLKRLWPSKLPPVIRPISHSSLESLIPSLTHQNCAFNDQLALMVLASFINVLLYPVENFYVPTLLSLQCAIVQFQLGIAPGTSRSQLDCASLLREFDQVSASPNNRPPSFCLGSVEEDSVRSDSPSSRRVQAKAVSGSESPRTSRETSEQEPEVFQAFLNMLGPEDLLQMITLFQSPGSEGGGGEC